LHHATTPLLFLQSAIAQRVAAHGAPSSASGTSGDVDMTGGEGAGITEQLLQVLRMAGLSVLLGLFTLRLA
jgi:hypothetical protein